MKAPPQARKTRLQKIGIDLLDAEGCGGRAAARMKQLR